MDPVNTKRDEAGGSKTPLRIAEHDFQRLLRETNPSDAIRALAAHWAPRATNAGALLGMSPPEHHVTMVLIYVDEIGTGGHAQFFSSRGGQIAARVRGALRLVGLADLATVLDGAIAIFPGGVIHADRDAVRQALGTLSDGRLAMFESLDRQVLDVDPYLTIIDYMRAHEGEVLRPERGLGDAAAI